MTAIVKYQISTKAPDGTIVVAAAEGADAGIAYDLFRAATEDLGLTAALARISNNPLDVAVTNAQPLVQPQPEPDSWGHPPVPQFQQTPPMPAAAQPQQQAPGAPPVCQHGPKQYKSGVSAKGAWAFWGCTARSDDPTKCEKQWVR